MTITYHITVRVDTQAFCFLAVGQSPTDALTPLMQGRSGSRFRITSRSAMPEEIAEAMRPGNRYSQAQAALYHYLGWRTNIICDVSDARGSHQFYDGFGRCYLSFDARSWTLGTSLNDPDLTAALPQRKLFMS